MLPTPCVSNPSFFSKLGLALLIASLTHLMPVEAQSAEHENDAPDAGQPLFEIGAGVGLGVFPNYRGSREYNVLPVPLPLFIYRGDILKSSREGVRAELIDHPRLDISISGAGTVPVDSDDDELRRGMSDLDPTLGIGPKISWLFSDPEQADNYSLRLQVPVYANSAVDFSEFDSEFAGFTVETELVWRQSWSIPEKDHDWSYSLTAGPVWASGEYHDYFYTVSPRFATATRPAFNAGGGYGGFGASAGVYHRRGKMRMGAFFGLDYLKGAAFDDSPLVATNEAYTIGLFVSWSLWQSQARAIEQSIE